MKLLWFIPSAICLLVALSGFVILTLSARSLKKARNSGAGSTRWTAWLKGFRVAGVVVLLSGLFGVWETGVSLAWMGQPPREWSDGHAPGLESLIRNRCLPFLNEGRSVGLTVAVVRQTNATVMAFGRPALSTSSATRGDTLFEIGSITKTFTALALEREIDQGLVRLDQPVRELLPSGFELPEAAQAVTLRHLTTHTSGFPRLPFNPGIMVGGNIRMLLFGGDPYASYTEAALKEDLRQVKLASPPGTKSDYSNFGMTVLGYLLAAKAGTNYEQLIKREVCHSLGMDDTTVTLDAAQAPRLAQGYRAVLRLGPFVLALRSSPWLEKSSNLGGAGALRSSGADMLTYLKANMHPEGQALEHALHETHRELFRENEHLAMGMNWLRSRNSTLKQVIVWHNGGTGGFRSFLGFTEDGRVGVMILSNTAESVDDLALTLLRELAGSAESREEP
jgi:CubicO group peptidase (beta-lactamase class C family)